MKHIILIVSLLMGVTLGVQAQPKALFDKTTHEFGTILWKNPVTVTFKITNKGDKPLVISNVTTSCGCTVADWTKEPIAPGKTGIVSSTFDAKAIGRFQKSVGIYCNASNKPIYLAILHELSASALPDYFDTVGIAPKPDKLQGLFSQPDKYESTSGVPVGIRHSRSFRKNCGTGNSMRLSRSATNPHAPFPYRMLSARTDKSA